MSQEPPHLDPTQADDSISIQVLRSITSPLVYYNADLEIVPGLADTWDVTPDATTFTFHLNKKATWSDGQPVGMATVVGTWRSAPRPAGATMLVGADGTAVLKYRVRVTY